MAQGAVIGQALFTTVWIVAGLLQGPAAHAVLAPDDIHHRPGAPCTDRIPCQHRCLTPIGGSVWPASASGPLIGLGCMRLSVERNRDEARGIEVLHAALDAGVTFFDTADRPAVSAGADGAARIAIRI